jgi:transcription initiation factor TFIIIB Brf1 subunit/transcription initiation factor TFIIB
LGKKVRPSFGEKKMDFCTNCQQNGAIVYEANSGHKVCTGCGKVTEENVVVSEKDLGGTTFVSASYFSTGTNRPNFQVQQRFGFKWIPTQNRCDGAKEAAKYIPRIVSSLGLPATMDEDAKAVLAQLLATSSAKTWRGQHGFEILAAACVYVACKKNRKPIVLAEIAVSMGRTPFEFGRCYKKLLGQLKAHKLKSTQLPGPANIREEDINNNTQNDPEHLISHTCCKRLDGIISDSATLQKISSLATKIARLAQKEFLLGTGRKPAAVVVAAIAVAASAFGYITKEDTTNPRKRKLASPEAQDEWNVEYEHLCQNLHVAATTAHRRRKEIEDFLVKKASSMKLPWAETIDRKNLRHHLLFMIKNLEFVTNVANSTSDKCALREISTGSQPPSYTFQEKQRNNRAEKIKRAKATISTILHPTTATPEPRLAEVLPSEEDLLIEKLLLEGVEEADILAGNYDSLLVDCKAKRQKLNMPSDESELSESDLSEKELNELIRSPEEIRRLEPLTHDDDDDDDNE